MTEQEIRDICHALPSGAPADESSWSFFSCSQYGRFCDCEAKALALLKKEWIEPESTALLFGKYFHSFFEGAAAFDAFCVENRASLFKKDGKLYADFAKAQPMFDKVTNDPKAMQFATGLHEVDIRGKIGGQFWRGKIDVLDVEAGWFCDLKAIANIYDGEWKIIVDDHGIPRNRKVSFIEAYHYHRQMAIYRELLKQKFDKEFAPIMLTVSKQDYPDIELIGFDKSGRLDIEVNDIIINQAGFIEIKQGKRKPGYCGRCDYCRSMKKVTRMITPDDLARMVI